MGLHIIGFDPGLRCTGWGVVALDGSHLRFKDAGRIVTDATLSPAKRLATIFEAIRVLFATHLPQEAAVEESFVNRNSATSLKLAQALGCVLAATGVYGAPASTYTANRVKKAVTGYGHAEKTQMRAMIARLLPGAGEGSADAIDALGVAVCHAFTRNCASFGLRREGAT